MNRYSRRQYLQDYLLPLSCWLYLNKVCPRLNQCLKQQNLAFGNWALVPIQLSYFGKLKRVQMFKN